MMSSKSLSPSRIHVFRGESTRDFDAEVKTLVHLGASEMGVVTYL